MRRIGQALAIGGVLILFSPGWLPLDPAAARGIAGAMFLVGLTVAVAGAILGSLPADARMDPLPGTPEACAPLVARIEALGFARLGPARRVQLEPLASIVPLWNETHRAYATVYVSDGAPTQAHYDFVTVFEGEVGLTSAASVAAGVLPAAPRSFSQVFPGDAPEDLLPRHLEGAERLAQAAGLRPAPCCDRFEDLLAKALRRQRQAFLRAPLRNTWTALWRVLRKTTPVRGPVMEQAGTRDRIEALGSTFDHADDALAAR